MQLLTRFANRTQSYDGNTRYTPGSIQTLLLATVLFGCFATWLQNVAVLLIFESQEGQPQATLALVPGLIALTAMPIIASARIPFLRKKGVNFNKSVFFVVAFALALLCGILLAAIFESTPPR